jgi:hypothetical protein
MAAGAGFAPGSSKLQRVLNTSQGVELHLPGEVVLSATAFLSRSWGLTDVTAICIEIEPPSVPVGQSPPRHVCPGNAGISGYAYGGELLVRRSLSQRLSGSLAYTLSRSVRESRFVTLEGGEVVATVPSDFDRTHVLNAVLAYDFGGGWRAGNRFVFYSGAPYSALSGNVPVAPYNSKRDPPFFRLDVRLEKRWLFGPERSIALVIEGQNVTLSQDTNTMGLDCIGDMTSDAYTTQCKRGKLPPLTIPSVGVEATF